MGDRNQGNGFYAKKFRRLIEFAEEAGALWPNASNWKLSTGAWCGSKFLL